MNRFLDILCKAIEYLIASFMAGMVVLVFGNVLLRYGFNSGITLSEELSRWLFVWMTFLGAIVAVRSHEHLGTDMLVSRLGPLGKKVCLGASYALMLFACWLLFKGSLDQTRINWDTTSAVMEASMGIFYASGMVLAVSGALILVDHLLRLMRGELADSELIGIRESEEEPIDVPAPLK
jgi:TRAP-type C4-dicarboxylate transport system permease small subunit